MKLFTRSFLIMLALFAMACGSENHSVGSDSSDTYDSYDASGDVAPDTNPYDNGGKDNVPTETDSGDDVTGDDVTGDDGSTDTFVPNLDDFMWIEGSWLCTEGNCITLDYNPIDVTVEGWDPDKGGAKVDGFTPCSNGIVYFDGVNFTFEGTSTSGTLHCSGEFDFENNLLEFDEYQLSNPDIKAPWRYELQ